MNTLKRGSAEFFTAHYLFYYRQYHNRAEYYLQIGENKKALAAARSSRYALWCYLNWAKIGVTVPSSYAFS
jgi:hypothetical protein